MCMVINDGAMIDTAKELVNRGECPVLSMTSTHDIILNHAGYYNSQPPSMDQASPMGTGLFSSREFV